jgi:hypothetical protein
MQFRQEARVLRTATTIVVIDAGDDSDVRTHSKNATFGTAVS